MTPRDLPLRRTRRILQRFVPVEYVSGIFDPMIADVQHQWLQQRRRGRRLAALGVRLGGYLCFTKTFALAFSHHRAALLPCTPWGALIPAIVLAGLGMTVMHLGVAADVGGLGMDIAGLQTRWMLLGLIAFIGASALSQAHLKAWKLWGALGFALLLMPALQGVDGPARWLSLGSMRLHSAQLCLPAFILSLGGIFSDTTLHRPRRWALGVVTCYVLATASQPDWASASLLSAIASAMFWRAGHRHAAILPGLASLAAIAPLVSTLAAPSLSPPHTDGVLFTTLEHLGVLGFGLIFLMIIALVGGLKSLSHVTLTPLSRTTAAGLMALVSAQTLLHTFEALGWIAQVGLGLPLVSYGGSSVVVLFALIGLVAPRQARDLRPDVIA